MKDNFDFNNLYLQQELKASNQPIWVAEFSFDGRFFATGSEDSSIKIWKTEDYLQQCLFVI